MSEEKRLKAKVNALLDKKDYLDQENLNRDMNIQLLEDEQKMLLLQEHSGGRQSINIDERPQSDMMIFLLDFCLVAKKIIENKDYIPYSYETQNSSLYYKIEKQIFDDYICKYARIDMKTFFKFCVDLAMIKCEKNRKYVYNAGKLKVYYVSRAFMEAAIQQTQEA